MKSEAEIWAEERERVAAKAARRQSALSRAFIAWRMPMPSPEPDVYAWRDVGDLFSTEIDRP